MKTQEYTVLDHLDNIVVPGSVFERPTNEYWALICLRDGMSHLYRQALRCDSVVKNRVNPSGNMQYLGFGNLPECEGIPKPLLTCSFHWYAISACQYVRTVGTIAYRQDSSRLKPLCYVKEVIPAVLSFRDKVAAHFAWTTKNKQDNDAERLISILPQLCFMGDSFHVGSFSLALRKAGDVSTSESVQAWSICKVHEELRRRYWPETQSKGDS